MGVCASLAACLCFLYACAYCVLRRINMMMMMKLRAIARPRPAVESSACDLGNAVGPNSIQH